MAETDAIESKLNEELLLAALQAARQAVITGYIAYAPAGAETLFDGHLAAGIGRLLADGSRKSLLGNTLVLVAPAEAGTKLELKQGADLAGALAGGKLAVADVKAVPAGKYAKAALTSLGLWAAAQPALAQTENVRAALALVARGEAKLGIVYATDAKSEPKVQVISVFPEASHAPIVYPVARLKASANPDAAAFETFLEGPEAAAIFKADGFEVLK